MARRRLLPFVFAFACMTAVPLTAFADESAAETLFQEGLAAMKRNDYPVACEAFSQSNKADPSPGTQINLAVCFEKQKKWASAWTWYRSAVGLAQQRGQKERETLAEESANRLKPQIHYIVVAVKETLTDLVVKRDGNEVTIALAGKEVPLPVDPGEHTLEVSARGKKTHTHPFKVEENNKTDRIEIPKLEDAPLETRDPGTPGVVFQPASANDGSGQRLAGIIIGGAGVLTGLTSLGVYILAKNEESKRDDQDIEASKIPRTDPRFDETKKSAKSHDGAAKNNQLISIIAVSGAAVLLGVGTFLYLTAPKPGSNAQEKKAAKEKRYILPLPLVGPGFGGAGVSGTF